MNLDLLVDLHKDDPRQGPGGEQQTKLAIALSGLSEAGAKLNIADVGCGTGASTLVLAENLDAEITAVDLFAVFLDILQDRAEKKGLSHKIQTLVGSMDRLPFAESSLDALWSEGAIYNMGFDKGVAYFERFIKPGGILAVSEMTWFGSERPDDVTDYWNNEYPEIAVAADKIRSLEQHGFMLEGYFPLPETCWLDNYYAPLERRFDAFLARHGTEDARSLITAEIKEIEFYKKYRQYYGYGFYIGRKVLD